MGALAQAPAAGFFAWTPAGVGAVEFPCPRCGATVTARLLENLLEVLCAACGRNVALERTRSLAAAEGVERVCEQLLALGVLSPTEVAAQRREGALPDDLVERLVDTGALRRDLRLVLDLDPSGGSHTYSAAPLTQIVDAEEVERALAHRRAQGGVLSEHLLQAALDRIAASLRAVGAESGLERLEDPADLDPSCRDLLPRRALEVYRAVPVRRAGAALVVALWDPLDTAVVNDLQALVGGPIHPILAEATALRATLQELGVERVEETPQEREVDDLAAELADDPLAAILLDALEEGAREVLIEPQGRVASLRFRVRGELRRRRTIPVEAADLLAERLGADAAREGRLHVGSARLEVSGLPIALDYRVVQTPFGPSLALELEADEPEVPPGLTGLGLTFEGLAAFEAIIAGSAGSGGLVVLAAPRRQGASQAYHAVLERLARLEREVISLERRIQRVVGGTTQLDLDSSARAQREALLRPVPDWLGVDGSLDPAWLETVVDAVLAGGSALITVPAPDAQTAVLRLRMAGVPAELLGRLLRGVLARRIVPRLCDRCRFPHPGAPPEAPSWIGLGCAACDQGVAGYLPLAELLLPAGAPAGGLQPAHGPLLRERLQSLIAEGGVASGTCADLLGPM